MLKAAASANAPPYDVFESKPARRGELNDPMEENVSRCVRRDLQRLPAAHRQPGHGAVLAVGERPVGRVDHRDQVVEDHVLEQAGMRGSAARGAAAGAAPGRGAAYPFSITTIIGSALPGGDQVVQDEVRRGPGGPAALVLARAVLQVQHRVARARVPCRNPAACRRSARRHVPVIFE